VGPFPAMGISPILNGLRADPLILVEGLFDALSLAAAGLPCVATIGRWVDWLPELAQGREVWLAFDGNRPGERSAHGFAASLGGSHCRRLRPPGGRGDWNAAARKIGTAGLARWLQKNAAATLEEIA
jgi:DNA primase